MELYWSELVVYFPAIPNMENVKGSADLMACIKLVFDMWQIILDLLVFVMMPKKPAITGSAKLVPSVSFFLECEVFNLSLTVFLNFVVVQVLYQLNVCLFFSLYA